MRIKIPSDHPNAPFFFNTEFNLKNPYVEPIGG